MGLAASHAALLSEHGTAGATVARRLTGWVRSGETAGSGVRWREGKDLPPGEQRFASPYDPGARYGVKRGAGWTGYKVHLTETCDEERPHLVTHVATTPATTRDTAVLAPIHGALADKELLPQTHLVDMGYTGADLLVSTARQLLLYRALNAMPPQFYHCSLMTDETGIRLAKRHDALSLKTLRQCGAVPEQLRQPWTA